MPRYDETTTDVKTQRPPPLPSVPRHETMPIVIDPHATRFSAPLAVTWAILVFVAVAGAYAGSEFRALKTQIETISTKQAEMLTKADLEQLKTKDLRKLFESFLRDYAADCRPNPSLGRGHLLCDLTPKNARSE